MTIYNTAIIPVSFAPGGTVYINAASTGNTVVITSTAYSNSVAITSTSSLVTPSMVNEAYTNAVTTSSADASSKATTAYSNAVAVSSTDATIKSSAAYSNAVATSSADATNKASNAYSNAIATSSTDASTKAGSAYTNAIATSSADATTKASAAYSNAIAISATDASTKAGTAYTNAIATSSTDATNKAANAYSNAVTYVTTGGYTISGVVNHSSNVNVIGSLSVSGNLVVTGNTVSIGANNLILQDAVISLHTQANLAPLTSNDGRLVGTAMHYFDNADRQALLAINQANAVLTYYSTSTDASSGDPTGTTLGTIQANTFYAGNASVYTVVNATSFSGTANNSTNLGGLSLATIQSQITSNASAAYSNAVTNAAALYAPLAGSVFTGPVSGITTLAAGNTTINGVVQSKSTAVSQLGITPSLDLNFALGQYSYGSGIYTTDASVIPGYTFTRSSGGYAEDLTGALTWFPGTRTNLALQSQFASGWTTEQAALSYVNIPLYDNSSSSAVALLTETSTTNVHDVYQSVTFTASTNYAISVYVKSNTANFSYINFQASSGRYYTAVFNLTDASTVASETSVGATAGTIVSTSKTFLQNGWIRLTVTGSIAGATSGSVVFGICSLSTGNSFSATNGQISYLGTGRTLYLYGAQVELATDTRVTYPTAYIPTTSAAVSADTPRITNKGYLSEESRTNSVLQSQTFGNWSATYSTVTSDTIAAPDGTVTADTLVFTADPYSGVSINCTLTATTYVFSVYAKVATGTKLFKLKYYNGTVDQFSSDFTATTTWQRFTFAITGTAVLGNVAITNIVAANVGTMYIWGAQLEAGAFATSYIPTTTAAATRAGDLYYHTGITGVSTATTLVGAATPQAPDTYATAQYIATIDDGTVNNRIVIYKTSISTPSIRNTAFVAIGGTGYTQTNVEWYSNTKGKLATSVTTNSFKNDFNGGAVVSSPTIVGYPSGLTRLVIGVRSDLTTSNFNGYIQNITVYSTAVTDAQLQSITSSESANTVSYVSGSLATTQNLLIGGNTAIAGTAKVTGATTLSSTLATGNTTITGTANISGAVTLASALATGNTTITGTANVSGATTLSSTLAAGNTTITGTANVSSAVTLASTLATGNTTVTGFVNVSNTVAVTGPVQSRSTSVNQLGITPSLDLNFALGQYSSGNSVYTTDASVIPGYTFTRSSGGYAEDLTGALTWFPGTRTNLTTYSQDLTNAAWSKANGTLATSTVFGPNNINYLQQWTATTSGGNRVEFNVTVTSGISYTVSAYVSAGSSTYAGLSFASLTGAGAIFSLTGSGSVVSTTGTLVSAVIQQISATLYRCSITKITDSTNLGFGIGVSNGSTYSSGVYPSATSGTIYCGFCQIESSTDTRITYPTAYIPTLSGQNVSADTPRITNKGYLSEEARTNLLSYSQDYSNAYWTKNNVTLTSTNNIAPDGTSTSTLMTATATFAQTRKVGLAVTAGSIYTLSVFAKAGNYNLFTLVVDNSPTLHSANFTLTGGGSYVLNSTWASASATITALANGWYKCTLTGAVEASLTTATFNMWMGIYSGVDYTGKSVYFWGAQAEQATFATSYIPTTTASATRAADSLTYSSLSIARPYTAVVSSAALPTPSVLARILALRDSSSSILSVCYNFSSNGSVEIAGTGLTNTPIIYNLSGNSVKAAISDTTAGVVKSSVNGLTAAAVTGTASITTFTDLVIGDNYPSSGARSAGGYIQSATIYPTAVTDAQLQAITLAESSNTISYVSGSLSTTQNLLIGGNTAISGTAKVTGAVTVSTNTVTIGTAAYHVANGNFGLGTSTPSQTLDVNGGTIIKGNLSIYSTYPRIFLTDTDNNPDYSIINADGNFTIYDDTNNAQRIVIPSNGNIGIGTSTPDAKLAVTGTANVSGAVTLASTLAAGNTTITGFANVLNNIVLSNSTSNWVQWNFSGVGAPTFAARSAGTKLVLYPGVNGVSAVDYAIGINSGTLWSSIPNTDAGGAFKWYGGQTEIASISGAGNLIVTGSANVGTTLQVSTNTATFGTAAYHVANGNLGLSNSAPAHLLSVNGTAYFSGAVLMGAGINVNGIKDTSGFEHITLTPASANATTFGTAAYIVANGNVGIGTSTPGYKLEVNGSFAATTKSFVIPHPTKPDMKLRYGSLEGPENGVYVRGKSDSAVIELPDYWHALIDEDTITVNLTPIGKAQSLFVETVNSTIITVKSGNLLSNDVKYYYTVFAERKDVDKLKVEI